MATLYKTDGTKRDVFPAAETFSLDELYALVGGHCVDIIGLGDGRMLVIDDNGKVDNRPLNRAATVLAAIAIAPDDVIVGDALLVGAGEIE